jgi:hypothetical protein
MGINNAILTTLRPVRQLVLKNLNLLVLNVDFIRETMQVSNSDWGVGSNPDRE